MDNVKNYIVIAVAVVAVVFGVIIFQKIPVVENTITLPNTAPMGAVSGNEIQGNEIVVGGVTKVYFSSGFNSTSKTVASTTVCMFKTGSATSTLQFISAKVSSSTMAATQYEFGKSSSQNATTTSFGTFSLASGIKATMVASTTNAMSDIDSPLVLAPNSYLTLKAGGTGGKAGTCVAETIKN